VAPETPVPFTRAVMTATVSDICAAVGGPPVSGFVATMLTWVPLERSSPRPILNCLCQWPGVTRVPPRMPRSMITMRAPSTASDRPGRTVLFAGGATLLRLPSGIVEESGQKASLSDFALLPLELARSSMPLSWVSLSCESARPSSADVTSSAAYSLLSGTSSPALMTSMIARFM
jgi:hypothetical protein